MQEQNNRPQSTLSKIGSFFSGNFNVNKKLSEWKQSGEQEDWAKKAVDVLVKKLKKQPRGIERLQTALKSRDPTSECVTIPRSIDGRLQISNCKALPHVIYCRVWRWPDLQSYHELEPVKTCAFPFAKNKTEPICINPYHYDRVVKSDLFPPVLVPRMSEADPQFTKLPMQQAPDVQQMPTNVVFDHNRFSAGNGSNTNFQCPSSSSSMSSPGQSISPSNYSNGYQAIGQYPNSAETTPSPPHFSQDNGFMQNQQEFVQVHYQAPEYWASISYYELNNRVGEQFRCSTTSNSIIVDGFTNPSTSNRFCVGQLSNVHRNSTIESTRKHIGKGVSISFINNELFLECLSDSPVFVQSSMANYLHGFPQTTVCKILPKGQFKFFDTMIFSNLLSQVLNEGFEKTFALTKMCTMRMSFAKGWGAQYHRQDVTSTPCWIEIHLNGPLKYLDDCLIKMESPLYTITSVS